MINDKDNKEKKEIEKTVIKPTKPGDIIGKIDVHDTRERRDGPGGN